MPTAPTPISTLPPAPSTNDPTNFADEADALLGTGLPTMVTEMNATGTNVYNNAVEVSNNANTVAANAASALTSKNNAATSEANALTYSGIASAAANSVSGALAALSATTVMLFNTSTSDADPGSGKIACNNATMASVTMLYVSNTDNSGNTISGWVDTWDDSTNAALRGTVALKTSPTGDLAVFAVTGAITTGSGYRKVPVTYLASGGTFSNGESTGVGFSRTNDISTTVAIGDTFYSARTVAGCVPGDGATYLSSLYTTAASVLPPALSLTSRTSNFSSSNIWDAAYDGTTRGVAVGDSGKVSVTTDGGETWSAQTPPTANNFFGVCWGNGLFVAVGASGTIYTSATGLTGSWSSRTSGTANQLNAVLWNGSLFVAVGASGTLLTSPDGVTWTSQTSGFGSAAINGVAWNGTVWCIVGASGNVATSSNGTAWNSQTTAAVAAVGSTQQMSDVCWTGTLFIVVGAAGTIITSPDGAAWKSRNSQASTTLNGVAYANGLILVVGNSGTLTYSTTGYGWRTWTSGFSSTTITDVATIGNTFVLTGASGLLSTCVADTTQFVTPILPHVLGSVGYVRIA